MAEITADKARSLPKKIIIAFIIILVVISGYTMAKYIMNIDSENMFVAKSFYFESDLLTEASDTPPQYQLQAGEDTITFSLMNYPDELRTSEVDIECEIILKSDSGDITRKTITLTGSEKDVQAVSFEGLSAGTYTVTANAVSPYTASLNAQFTVIGLAESIGYSVSDGEGSPILKVTVTSTDYEGDITINWPEGVYPDITDPLLENASGQSTTVSVDMYSEYTFQFFKEDPNENYTDEITVTN